MKKNNLLILYDSDDEELLQEVIIGLSNLIRIYSLKILTHEIISNLKLLLSGEVVVEELEILKSLFESSFSVLILGTQTMIISNELNLIFKESQSILKGKNIFFLNSRYCTVKDWIWINDVKVVGPRSGLPLKHCEKLVREQIIYELNINLRNFLDDEFEEIISTPKVFISYSHKDGYFADLLKYKLIENEIEVSIDIDYLVAGKNWKIGIDYEINNSEVILVIHSTNSKKSEYVLYEWAYAMAKNKLIIPIVIEEGIELHPKLCDLETFNGLIDRKNQNWDKLIEIIKIINQ